MRKLPYVLPILRLTRGDWESWLRETYRGRAPETRLAVCKANVDWLLRKVPITTVERRDLKSLQDLCDLNNWQ